MARPGGRLPPVTLYADKEQVASAFKKATHPWICLNCGESYSLLESMGTLSCSQHPGYIQEDGKWSCCGIQIYPARYSPNNDMQRLYVGNGCAGVVPKVRGCQRSDHNTSKHAWNHTDACEISNLAALLPFMNTEFPFQLRAGFDKNSGVLRRCGSRLLHVPHELGAVVTYLNNNGQTETYTVEQFTNNKGDLISYGKQPVPLPNGMEQKAVTKEGKPISLWWG